MSMKNDEIKKLPSENQKKLADFLATIPKIPYLKPDGKPKKEWKVFYGRTWNAAWDAASGASRDTAMNTASNAAWDTTWNTTINAVKKAASGASRDTASNIASDAARNAAMNAILDTASNAAWDTNEAASGAAWDTALIARFIVVEDLEFKDKEKHLAHAQARWEVWKKGYGLLCDVDGVLYVYAIKTPKNENTSTFSGVNVEK